ncbi:hypothetical protein GGP63_002760 [Salinibacter ruber]|nr:hypothetical protein [Salinibacter ruber]MCS3648159.1 hypothetical protein [Salinibacter ruber]
MCRKIYSRQLLRRESHIQIKTMYAQAPSLDAVQQGMSLFGAYLR